MRQYNQPVRRGHSTFTHSPPRSSAEYSPKDKTGGSSKYVVMLVAALLVTVYFAHYANWFGLQPKVLVSSDSATDQKGQAAQAQAVTPPTNPNSAAADTRGATKPAQQGAAAAGANDPLNDRARSQINVVLEPAATPATPAGKPRAGKAGAGKPRNALLALREKLAREKQRTAEAVARAKKAAEELQKVKNVAGVKSLFPVKNTANKAPQPPKRTIVQPPQQANPAAGAPAAGAGGGGGRGQGQQRNNARPTANEVVAGNGPLSGYSNSKEAMGADTHKADAIVAAFRHCWKGYKENAFGSDEYRPLSKTGTNDFAGGLGLTMIDALDTAILMKQEDIVREAVDWVHSKVSFHHDKKVNLFETTIRVLGGILSAYALTKNDMFIGKATDLADRLLGAFTSPSDVPWSDVNLATHRGDNPAGVSSTAEVTTIQLEFRYLSKITGNKKYREAVDKVMRHFKTLPKTDGLVPIFINPHSGGFQGSEIRLGSRGDSYYEYLLKQWLQTNRTEGLFKEMYDEAVGGIVKHLIAFSKPKGLTYVGELPSGRPGDLNNKMDHLVCFLGGTLALGATRGVHVLEAWPLMSPQDREIFTLGKQVTESCNEMYTQTASGLAAEITFWNRDANQPRDVIVHGSSAHNLLRPETVESIFYLYRLTGDPKYRKWGWDIFSSFQKWSRVESGGYANVDDVTRTPPHKRDKMESFFLAETLKYLYLLFADQSVLPLTDWVFNTEAHPLPVFNEF